MIYKGIDKDFNFNYIYTSFWRNDYEYVRYTIYLRPSKIYLKLIDKYYSGSSLERYPKVNLKQENMLVCLSEMIKDNLNTKDNSKDNLILRFTFSTFQYDFNILEELSKYEEEIRHLYTPKSFYRNEIFVINTFDNIFNPLNFIDTNVYPRLYPYFKFVFKENILIKLCHSYSSLFMYKLNYIPLDIKKVLEEKG